MWNFIISSLLKYAIICHGYIILTFPWSYVLQLWLCVTLRKRVLSHTCTHTNPPNPLEPTIHYNVLLCYTTNFLLHQPSTAFSSFFFFRLVNQLLFKQSATIIRKTRQHRGKRGRGKTAPRSENHSSWFPYYWSPRV